MHFSKYVFPSKREQKKYFYSKFSYFIKKNFYILKKKVLIWNTKNKLLFKKKNNENNLIEKKSFLNNSLNNNLICLKSNYKSSLDLKNLYLNEQIIIYNIVLKNNSIENIDVEILFKTNNFTYKGIENFSYLEIFYRRLKSKKIKNKLINIYRSKINNIYSNLLFYHFSQRVNNFLLHNNVYKQFSYVLQFFFHKILNINFLLYKKKITKSKYVKKKFYKVSKIEKFIQNYIFKLLNNVFINNFLFFFKYSSNNLTRYNDNVLIKNNNIINNTKCVEENGNINKKEGKLFCINELNKNKIELDRGKNNKNNIPYFRRVMYKCVKKKNYFNFKLDINNRHYCKYKKRTNVHIFQDFNVLNLDSIFLKVKNGNNSDLLKTTFEEFLKTLSRKNKNRKIYLESLIKCYTHIFTFNDIFIVDKENVNKFFFFFYYHSLNNGYTFFFYNRKVDLAISKKNNIKRKRKVKIKSLKYNIIPDFLKRKTKKKKKNQYFLNLNNEELKHNSSDNYIILFLYDLIFNFNFQFSNYINYKYNVTNIDRKYTVLNKKIKNKIKKGRIILFTNDKKIQSMCFKMNIFYQNCFVEEKNKNSVKICIFSEILNKNKKKNNNKADSYKLYAFSKTFHI
ncbi:hypothetical protein PGAL8A_00419400 [Plasmodium gallinaceum]|uniref:Uncharacterized protein n=1 Tax=Plasmodium gallinaceum TaxID=5849 RepID=A0A1J1GVX3_PLAGA|nr:hypothetical protein PGAL8A_00419400 [Plasmodium gallinaceum]CRG96614.1 hypothetical protein PGAL8A_00419400 [Plasmodium gallinaceum]